MEKYTPSESILEKIREYEKFVNHWYKDGNGFWTLGYGHKKTLNDTVDNRKISEQQALDLFNNDVNSRVGTFLNATPNWQKFNQSELDALFDLFYNIGEHAYKNKSPKLQLGLKTMDKQMIVDNMDHGYNDTKNPGLRKRRDFERNLFKGSTIKLETPICFNKIILPQDNTRVYISPRIAPKFNKFGGIITKRRFQ